MALRGNGSGARDGDPIAILILLFMTFVVLVWFSIQSFSPFQGGLQCVSDTCKAAVAGDFASVVAIGTPLLTLAIPMTIAMFGFYIMKEITGEDPSEYFETRFLGAPVYQIQNQQMEQEEEDMEEEDQAEEDASGITGVSGFTDNIRKISRRRSKAEAENPKPAGGA